MTLCLLAASGPALAGIDEAVRALGELKWLDLSALNEPAKRELAEVLVDEFDGCGRPVTLLAALRKGDACTHTKRMARLAALEASHGTDSSELLRMLAQYNQSFSSRRATFKLDERMCLGAKNAKVTVVEFSDFECPYCALARPMLAQLATRRAPDGVRLCSLPYPLPGHAHSTEAALAVLFARDAGRFWALHDLVFDHHTNLSSETLKSLAKKAGLDLAQLKQALDAKTHVAELESFKEAGRAAGVDSTPSIFINGRRVEVRLSAETLSLTVDDELDWLANGNAWPTN